MFGSRCNRDDYAVSACGELTTSSVYPSDGDGDSGSEQDMEDAAEELVVRAGKPARRKAADAGLPAGEGSKKKAKKQKKGGAAKEAVEELPSPAVPDTQPKKKAKKQKKGGAATEAVGEPPSPAEAGPPAAAQPKMKGKAKAAVKAPSGPVEHEASAAAQPKQKGKAAKAPKGVAASAPAAAAGPAPADPKPSKKKKAKAAASQVDPASATTVNGTSAASGSSERRVPLMCHERRLCSERSACTCT